MPAVRADRVSVAVLVVSVACAALPEAASAKASSLPTLDLKLRRSDLAKLQAERKRPGGYALTVRDDPWSVLANRRRPVAGPDLPQITNDQRLHSGDGEEFSFKKLLDGATFPILKIDVSPSF
jgi:hypothetical protein